MAESQVKRLSTLPPWAAKQPGAGFEPLSLRALEQDHPSRVMPHAGHERQHLRMLIALLAVLGVDPIRSDLIVIVAVLAVVLSRRRWVAKQPGVFKGAIRVVVGEFDGLGPK